MPLYAYSFSSFFSYVFFPSNFREANTYLLILPFPYGISSVLFLVLAGEVVKLDSLRQNRLAKDSTTVQVVFLG